MADSFLLLEGDFSGFLPLEGDFSGKIITATGEEQTGGGGGGVAGPIICNGGV